MNSQELKQTPRLIAKLCDGSIATDEMEQLNRQLLEDPIAMEAYIDHLEVDAMLEREFGGQPLEIIPQSQNVSDGGGSKAVVDFARSPKPRDFWRSPLRNAALAAALLVALGLFLNSLLRRADDPPFAMNVPLVVQSADDTQVRLADGASLPLDVGRSVRAGETIETNDGGLRLRYDDGTEIALSRSSSLRIGESADEGKRLELQEGVLQADVVPQTSGHELVVVTPHIAIRVLGTRFELEASESSGTRLELESGRVELDRGDQSPVTVKPGSIAIVPPGDKPIRIEPRASKSRKPDRTVEFPWLQSVEFSDDGETLIAGTRWGALYWHNDDRLEAVPATARQRRNGIRFKAHRGSMFVFAEFEDEKRLLVWDSATRQAVTTLDDVERGTTAPELQGLKVVAISPQRDWLALCVDGRPAGEFEIHDLSSGQVALLERPNMAILAGAHEFRGIVVSPDGSKMTMPVQSADEMLAIELLVPQTGQQIATMSTGRRVKELLNLGFSADGGWLALAFSSSSQGPAEIQVWNTVEARRVTTIADAGYRPEHVAISRDGRRVAVRADSRQQVFVWEVVNPIEPLVLECDEVLGAIELRFSPNGSKLAARVGGGRLALWYLEESAAAPRPRAIAVPDREAQFPRLRSFDFSSDGRTIVAMTDRGAIYWQGADDEIETVRAVTGNDVRVVTRSGSLVAFEEREPRRLVFWDATTGETVRVVDDLDQIPAVFAFENRDDKKPSFPSLRIDVLSPRGDWIAVHSVHSRVKGKDSLHLFDLAKRESQIIERDCLMMYFRASPDGSLLAIGQSHGGLKNSGTIELISVDSGEHVMLLTVLEKEENQRPGIVQSLFEFSPDGQHLAVAIRGRLRIWDLTTGDRVANIEDAGNVRRVAISSGAEWVAGVCPKSPIRLWNVADPHKSFLLAPASSTQAVRFSPDGQELAAQLSGGQLRVWKFGSQSKSTNVAKP